MFIDIFKQIVTTKEFIIILIVMLIVFPIIFSLASRSKKETTIKKIPKKAVTAEKKSLKKIPAQVRTA